MTIQTIIDYDNPAEFTFSPTQVRVRAGGAELRHQPIAGNVIESYTSDTGFTYDPLLLAFAAGIVSQVDQTPTNSILGATYTSSLNANWNTGGAVTAVLNGTPVLNAGKLDCFGANGLSYAHTTTAIETHKMIWTPNYSGIPGATENISTSWNGSNLNDHFRIIHTTTGTVRIQVYDSSGVQAQSLASLGAAFLPTAGTDYELEFVIDSVAGTIRFFIDGVLHATLSPGAWTRGGIVSGTHLGATTAVYNSSQASFEDYVLFSDAQHTVGYAPGYTLPEDIYAEALLELPVLTPATPFIDLSSFSAVFLGTTRFIIHGMYWDGAMWTASDNSYAQGSAYADVQTNISTLDVDEEASLNVSIVFAAAATTSTIDSHIIGINTEGDFFAESSIVHNALVDMSELVELAEVSTLVGSDTIQYVIYADGSPLYWDGAAWVTSNVTLAQSNTIAVITANRLSLPIQTGASVQISAILSSFDGSTTPILTQLTITHIFGITEGCAPDRCTVYGCILDNVGVPVEGAKISVNGADYFYTEGLLAPNNDKVALISRKGETFSTAEGEWGLSIVETVTDSTTVDITIEYKQNGKTIKNTYTGLTIPQLVAQPLGNIVNP